MNPRLSRKKEIARRTFVYTLMTLSMLVLLGFLMMMVLGYQINLKTRSVEQTGLVQYGSLPTSAQVLVDGAVVGRTNTKSNVLPGKRQFAMQLAGYEPWQKTLSIDPGTLTWLTYVRLVPVEKKIIDIGTFSSVQTIKSSPSSRYMAAWSIDAEGQPVFTSLDFRNSSLPSRVDTSVDTGLVSGFGVVDFDASHRFAIKNWSANGRYVATSHTYVAPDGAKHEELLWQDMESPANVISVGRLTGLDIIDLEPVNSREVYVLSRGGDVRQVNLDNGTSSRPLIEGVTSLSLYSNEVLTFTAKRADEHVAGLWQKGFAQPIILATVPIASERPLRIASSNYFHKDSVAISIGDQVSLYRGMLPKNSDAVATFMQTAKSINFNRSIDNLQFGSNGRFLLVEDGKGFISYDIERQEISQTIRKYHPAPLTWLDGYHLQQVDESGQLILQEFDGINANKLMPVTVGWPNILTGDGKYVYGWVEEDGLLLLRRLSMTI